LRRPPLDAFAPNALGIAAAGGKKEALDILFDYKQWQILELSFIDALTIPVEANVPAAVDEFASRLSAIKPGDDSASGGAAIAIIHSLGVVADKGNPKARAALDKFNGAGSNN